MDSHDAFPYHLLETLDDAELRCLIEDMRYGELEASSSSIGLVVS